MPVPIKATTSDLNIPADSVTSWPLASTALRHLRFECPRRHVAFEVSNAYTVQVAQAARSELAPFCNFEGSSGAGEALHRKFKFYILLGFKGQRFWICRDICREFRRMIFDSSFPNVNPDSKHRPNRGRLKFFNRFPIEHPPARLSRQDAQHRSGAIGVGS